ncbi:PhoX family protein [Paenibacillus hamazuiensis]|uniref:PhoX family protein n=1 Tax=Paenibacillus hamazuiensis TaxID=2936508 RepID=UPI00200C0F15|nr:alkaline phosphatase PhoX [Paenibacillus hamazuiensis]
MDKNKQITRRRFLAYLGTGAATIATASSGLSLVLGGTTASAAAADRLFDKKTSVISGSFTPIEPSGSDRFIVPSGYKIDTIAAFGDPLNDKGETFGTGATFSRFFPLGDSSSNGLLVVGHAEAPDEDAQSSLSRQGVSVLEVYRSKEGSWQPDTSSPYARRISGLDPADLTGPARGSRSLRGATRVQGTFANRSAAATPWGTLITGEAAFDDTSRASGLDPSHYGWIVELDPFDAKSVPQKHTALGRFRHGGISVSLTKDGRVAVYMGDSTNKACLYKYISKGIYNPDAGKNNSKLLADGTLYAANLEKGSWIQLDFDAVKAVLTDLTRPIPAGIGRVREDLKEKLADPSDVYVYAYESALLLGATPTDRFGDIAVCPIDNSVFLSYPNNPARGSIHGQIIRLFEENDDAGASSFHFDVFAAGGRQGGFSSPDALAFDRQGNLWATSDMPVDRTESNAYAPFQNNGLYVIPNRKQADGKAVQFASAPRGARCAGAAFAPDERTLFVSLQRETTGPAIVAITGVF